MREIELKVGDRYTIDADMANSGEVELIELGRFFSKVRDPDTGSIWDTMTDRLSPINHSPMTDQTIAEKAKKYVKQNYTNPEYTHWERYAIEDFTAGATWMQSQSSDLALELAKVKGEKAGMEIAYDRIKSVFEDVLDQCIDSRLAVHELRQKAGLTNADLTDKG